MVFLKKVKKLFFYLKILRQSIFFLFFIFRGEIIKIVRGIKWFLKKGLMFINIIFNCDFIKNFFNGFLKGLEIFYFLLIVEKSI